MKWILNLADSARGLAAWRPRLVKYDYDVQHRPRAKQNVAEEESGLRGSEEEQDVLGDKVPCFLIEGSPNGVPVQPKHREAVIGFWGSTEARTLTEDTSP